MVSVSQQMHIRTHNSINRSMMMEKRYIKEETVTYAMQTHGDKDMKLTDLARAIISFIKISREKVKT